MKTSSIGQAAESLVAARLERLGYKILNRNWKTKVCEIDIVARKDKIIYFVEVKYRSSSAQGTGLDYIGPQKLKRLQFAAQVWVQNHNFEGDYRLLGTSVTSESGDFSIVDMLEIN